MAIRRVRVARGSGQSASRPEAGEAAPRPQLEAKQERKPWRIAVDQLNEATVVAAGLAAGLHDPATLDRLLLRVRPDSFQVREHAQLWDAIGQARRRRLEPDLETIRRLLADPTLVEYAGQLRESRPDVPANLDFHVGALEWDRVRVEAARGPASELVAALQRNEEHDRVRALARQLAEMIDSAGGLSALRDPAALHRQAITQLDDRMAGSAFRPYGIVGFDVDADGRQIEDKDGQPRITYGTAPGLVTLITAVTGQGKSSLLRALIAAQVGLGHRLLVGPWEEPAWKMLHAVAAQRLGIPRWRVTAGRIGPLERQAMEEEMHRVQTVARFADNPLRTGRRGNEATLDMIFGLVSDAAADVAVIDLFARAFEFGSVGEENAILHRLQAGAEELGVHFVLTQQQVHKQTQKSDDPRPTKHGIFGPGGWAEMPDTIIGVYRPGLYANVPDESVELHVLKQRDGRAPLCVDFAWSGADGTITDGEERPYDRAPRAQGSKNEDRKLSTRSTGR